MSLRTRFQRLKATRPRCDGRTLRLAPEGHVPSDADRCRRCGGCHVLVIVEEIVEAPVEPQEVRA
ncbi:hypothetical protein GobsT_51520 [Gemmata obscuriglobus]|uniref:Uncharacterized protein n=1 Tax=Gemmata obscuriglobus TaxID=114 RepID=A0A2Z3GUL0_9BACT|nr:hypothetical protein [Gemmata obscuriglobus]AWM36968.1 hypothetical protein C1280_08000 [Gemmata obscuriglobus]QEG30347.1 hypothetical protein GobsT_51520 [Gemmata obscuriglobus]VTS09671.1 unnamed protein product [Gemmata obscuriglobus UQM 2246]